jgi:hypothetical protein
VRTPGRSTNDELPAYKKPSHPLDVNATRALRALQDRSLADVKKHNKKATETITNTAASVNDMLRDHADYIKRRQNKWNTGKGLEDKEEEERTMQELQTKVDEATKKLEESMRAVIDSGVATHRIDETLDWMRLNAPKNIEEEYQTQISQRATQRQRQTQAESQRRQTQDGDGDEAMDDAPTPGPTPLDGSVARVELTGASEMFTTRMQREKNAYTSLSYTARYARNNEYRDFKRMVHDAKYGDSGPTLGHEDTWFTETGSPAPGVTDGTQRGDFDDDDDIIVDKATISTKCPLTYQQLKDPYTSTKCPHTFEKNAILEMIRQGPHVINGQKAVTCPVSGCDHVSLFLTLQSSAYRDLFHTDHELSSCSPKMISVPIRLPFARSSASNKPKPKRRQKAQTMTTAPLVAISRILEATTMSLSLPRECRPGRRSDSLNQASSKTWETRVRAKRICRASLTTDGIRPLMEWLRV